MKQKREIRAWIGIWLCIFLSSCAFGKIEKVKPGLYQSLPDNLRGEVQEKRQKNLHVVQGKIAKARTDFQDINQDVLVAEKELQDRETEIEFKKKSLRELKRDGGNDYEIRSLKEDLKLARHSRKIAKQELRYKNQIKKTHEQKIAVLQARERVLISQIELDKIRSVHEYTEWKVPDAEYQVAGFKRQLRRFELKESRAQYTLSKRELEEAEAKRNLRFLQGQMAILQEPEKERTKKQETILGKPLFLGS